jgi:hypothetical protein
MNYETDKRQVESAGWGIEMQGQFNFRFEMQMQLELIKVDSNKLGGFFDHCLDSKIEEKGK